MNVLYKCQRCGEASAVQIKALGNRETLEDAVRMLEPRLHICPRGRGENDPTHLVGTERIQGVMLPISIWE